MKVLESNANATMQVRCTNCNALLEVEPSDIEEYYSGGRVMFHCPECKGLVWTRTDNEAFFAKAKETAKNAEIW